MNLQQLRRVALKAPNDHFKHAAGLYTSSGKLIVAASNRMDEHAEHRVIKRYFAVDKFRQQKIAYMVVIRVSRRGVKLASSKPCRRCQRLLDGLGLLVLHSVG